MTQGDATQPAPFDNFFNPRGTEDFVDKLVSKGTGASLLGGGLTVLFGTLTSLFALPQGDAIAAIVTGGLLVVLGGLFNLYVYRRDTEIYILRFNDASARAKRLGQAEVEAAGQAAKLPQPAKP